jgi:hypothetical protein
LFALNKYIIPPKKRGGSDPGLLGVSACRSTTPHPQHTPCTGLLPVNVLWDRKCTHLRKSAFLVALTVVDFVRKNVETGVKNIDLLKL